MGKNNNEVNNNEMNNNEMNNNYETLQARLAEALKSYRDAGADEEEENDLD